MAARFTQLVLDCADPALGAVRVDIGEGELPRVVLADPERNEFCVMAGRVDPLPGSPA